MPWSLLLHNALVVGLGPGLVAAIVALLAWRPWSETRETAGGLWAGPVAVAGAFLTGQYLIHGTPEIAPVADGGWIVHVAVVALVVGLVEALYHRNSIWLGLARVALLGGGLYFVINFMFVRIWSDWMVGASFMGGIVGLGVLSMWTLEKMARRHSGATMPLVLHILAVGASLVITFAHSASTGQMLGTLAVATAVFVAVSWWKGQGRVSLARGGVTVFTTLLVLEMAIGYFNAPDPNVFAMITVPAIIASPLVLWIGEFPPISDLSGWRGTAARAALMASGVAVIATVAFLGY